MRAVIILFLWLLWLAAINIETHVKHIDAVITAAAQGGHR